MGERVGIVRNHGRDSRCDCLLWWLILLYSAENCVIIIMMCTAS